MKVTPDAKQGERILTHILEKNGEELLYFNFQDNQFYLKNNQEWMPLGKNDQTILDYVYPSDRLSFVEMLHDVRSQETLEIQKKIRMLPCQNDAGSCPLYKVQVMADYNDENLMVGLILIRREIKEDGNSNQHSGSPMNIYSNTLEQLPQSVLYFDDSGCIKECNPAACKLIERLLNRNVHQLNLFQIDALGGEIKERIIRHERFTEIVSFGRSADILYSWWEEDKDPKVYFIEVTYMPIFDEQRQWVTNLMIMKDITTEHIKALCNDVYRRKNKAINERLGISRIDYFPQTGTYTIEYFGAKEMERNNPIELAILKTVPEDRPLFRELAAKANEGNEECIDMKVRMFSDALGSLRYVRFIFLRECHEDRPTTYAGIMLDYTDTKLMEEEKTDANEMLDAILNRMPSPVFVKEVDNDYRYCIVSESFGQIYNMPREEFIGKNDYELVDVFNRHVSFGSEGVTREMADWWHSKDEAASEYTASNPLVLWEEFEGIDGKKKYLKTEKFVFNLNGRRLLIGCSSDVTELQEARIHAEEADKLKSSFLMNITHEIRTPLNAIVGFSELLVESIDVKERNMCKNLITQNKDHLLLLFDRVITLAKLESGSMVFYQMEFDLEGLINEIYSDYPRVHPLYNTHVQFLQSEHLESILVNQDRKCVYEILSNYLSNAFKYTHQGTVTIGYERDGDGVQIWVKDTGIGIALENQERIFDRFEKIDSFVPGTGLGLCICKSMAQALGGHVGLTSELGVGSKFWVWLPINM